jgi:hypothetical protein
MCNVLSKQAWITSNDRYRPLTAVTLCRAPFLSTAAQSSPDADNADFGLPIRAFELVDRSYSV